MVHENFLVGLLFDKKSAINFFPDFIKKETLLHKEVKRQLRLYFNKQLIRFDLPIKIDGTIFQKSVWRELQKIRFGEVRNYSDIAKAIDSPKAARAVGAANGKNKIGIIIPCHRVIGKNGKLTGFAGGINMKKYLLKLEA